MDTDTDTDSTGRHDNQGTGSYPHKELSFSLTGDENRKKLLERWENFLFFYFFQAATVSFLWAVDHLCKCSIVNK